MKWNVNSGVHIGEVRTMKHGGLQQLARMRVRSYKHLNMPPK